MCVGMERPGLLDQEDRVGWAAELARQPLLREVSQERLVRSLGDGAQSAQDTDAAAQAHQQLASLKLAKDALQGDVQDTPWLQASALQWQVLDALTQTQAHSARALAGGEALSPDAQGQQALTLTSTQEALALEMGKRRDVQGGARYSSAHSMLA